MLYILLRPVGRFSSFKEAEPITGPDRAAIRNDEEVSQP